MPEEVFKEKEFLVSPLKLRTPTIYIVFTMNKDVRYQHVIPKNWNTILIV